MVKNLSDASLELIKNSSNGLVECTPEFIDPVIDIIKNSSNANLPLRRMYFINEIVEWELTQYIWTGCTRIVLRDQIMSHATELIRQIIRKQGLHTIYPGQEESAFGDLIQTGWCQIERTLYKYRARPHCRYCYNHDRPNDSVLYNPGPKEYGIITIDDVVKKTDTCPKCGSKLKISPMLRPKQGLYGGSESIIFRGMSKVFNMWSQISRTVILAYIKKEGRDRKNSQSYLTHLGHKQRGTSDVMVRFVTEARQLCQHNPDHMKILTVLENLVATDAKPHDGLISKLVDATNLPRPTVVGFLRLLKLCSFEFTDSPANKMRMSLDPTDRRRNNTMDQEDET